jgi:hypothetical protein
MSDQPPAATPDPADAAQTPLERRYRRLLRVYPAPYRADRADEIVGTYLDLVDPRRRWPSPGDALDVLRGGLHERLRGYGALGLLAALPLAASLALHTLLALSAFLLVRVELATPPVPELPTVGPVQTLGAVVWLGWLVVGLSAPLLPGRWTRRAALAVVLLTLALPAAAGLTGQPRPPLLVLVPTTALGLVTLALPAEPGRLTRILTPLAAGVGAVASGAWWDDADRYLMYHSTPEILAAAGELLVALAVAVALRYTVNGDDRGLWATLLLAVPAGLLTVQPLTKHLWAHPGGSPSWGAYAGTSVLVVLAGGLLLAAMIASRAARHRAVRRRLASGVCPTCGHRPVDEPAG